MAIKNKILNFIKLFVCLKYDDCDGKLYLYIKKYPFKKEEDSNQNLFKDHHIKTFIHFDPTRVFKQRYEKLPIQNNKIVFDNYMGKGYGCNPKYVAEEIIKKYPGKYDLVWLVSKKDIEWCKFPKEIRPVIYEKKEALKEYATAKIWVSNYHKISFIKRGLIKKPGQIFIQMWHGSLGIKKIESDVEILTKKQTWLSNAIKSSTMVDYWISNSTFETEIYKNAFWITNGKILELGHPRNDVLIANKNSCDKKVKKYFGISEDKRILLYVPTFREDYRLDCYRLDYELLETALKEKFGGEWAFVVRLHPRIRKFSNEGIIPEKDNIYNASFYDDIQELLTSADCLISDYSSCMFDYILTEKPVFIFATDIDEYVDERGFYYPLSTTPFLVSTNNEELKENINQFDLKKYKDNVRAFLSGKGCIDDGKASSRVAGLIFNETNGIKST